MKMEIERKFLVDVPKFLSFLAKNRPEKQHIIQGYLRDTAPYVRIRVLRNGPGVITVKGEGAIERAEVEVEIPEEDAAQIITMCPVVLEKTRYKVKHTWYAPQGEVTQVWDVDAFHGKLEGLVIAEIELRSIDETFEKPSWLGPEVSEDGRYANVNLIKADSPPLPA